MEQVISSGMSNQTPPLRLGELPVQKRRQKDVEGDSEETESPRHKRADAAHTRSPHVDLHSFKQNGVPALRGESNTKSHP